MAEPRHTMCIHGVEDGCERCRFAAAIHEWSLKELTRFMGTDVISPETGLALDVFFGMAPS